MKITTESLANLLNFKDFAINHMTLIRKTSNRALQKLLPR